MDTIKAAIVDDEAGSRRILGFLLAEHCPDVEVIGSFSSGAEALPRLPDLKPELLFLDIDMPGMNGFELLDRLKGQDLKVIFVTAHDQYAIRAFKYLAIDYLLKPVNGEALAEAVAKVRRLSVQQEQRDLLVRHMRKREALPDVIALPMSYGLEIIQIADILYCVADRNYTTLYRQGKEKLLVTRQIKEFEKMLVPHGFFRVHNSTLVNLKHVQRFVRTDGSHLQMSDGSNVEVARARKEEFLQLLQRI